MTKMFGSARALDEVELEVRRGEVVVLLGRSGAGKSTLLRHVAGLQQATSGGLTVLGTEVSTARERELRRLRRRIGFVFQGFQLVGRLSALENACSGALGRLAGPRLGLATYPRAVRRLAAEQLDRVGLSAQAYQRADTLSGGEQQRVAIARALVQQPQILLADEPVAALDPSSATTVLELLRGIAREEQLTVICSLHQVAPALSFATRVVGLRSGRVFSDQQVSEVDEETLARVYGAAE
ncbi:phosphonate ABC transporter ATP-binding protein [Kribbella antibiotica]|uniref:Phosphonate ABC transporter ATP-binding protein n=1 Tax=Kribbella antibiotica TaxID=190195 RepID=A0A4R4ZM16_9ACTN|nr:phosphonate ABC transporter ATP-binding protein [Kribbella antibiotica]